MANRDLGGSMLDSELDAERRRRERAEREAAEVLERQGIAGRMADMDFESYVPDEAGQKVALDACLRFAKNPEGTLGLIGSVGTGKTHLAVSVCRAADGTYTTMMRMIRNIRETYRPGCRDTEQERIDYWAGVGLLVIDEIGVQAGSDSERMLLYEILNERTNIGLPTVLVSNETQEAIAGLLGERAMDRITERGQVVMFTWKSHRQQHG